MRAAGASKPVRTSAKRTTRRARRQKPRRFFRYTLSVIAALVCFFYVSVTCALIALKWIDPPTTSVQMERRVESWLQEGAYGKQYRFMPLSRISPNLQHAIIAAEDARFYQHHGFDWKQVRIAAADDLEGRRMRGASTIDQQLVKNLFLTTSRSPLRKLIEATLVPPAEIILGKQRILELYLNIVEWAPGVYGCEAASQRYFHLPAARVSREQGARLAAVLPAPRRRNPAGMTLYAHRILLRMRQMGW